MEGLRSFVLALPAPAPFFRLTASAVTASTVSTTAAVMRGTYRKGRVAANLSHSA